MGTTSIHSSTGGAEQLPTSKRGVVRHLPHNSRLVPSRCLCIVEGTFLNCVRHAGIGTRRLHLLIGARHVYLAAFMIALVIGGSLLLLVFAARGHWIQLARKRKCANVSRGNLYYY